MTNPETLGSKGASSDDFAEGFLENTEALSDEKPAVEEVATPKSDVSNNYVEQEQRNPIEDEQTRESMFSKKQAVFENAQEVDQKATATIEAEERKRGEKLTEQERVKVREKVFQEEAEKTKDGIKDEAATAVIPGVPPGKEGEVLKPEGEKEAEAKREDLKKRLENYEGGFQGLLEDFIAMEGIQDPQKKQAQRAKIKEKLVKALGPGSEEDAEKILKNLGKSEQLDKMSILLMQLQLRQLLEIDEKEGTNHYEEAQKIINDPNLPMNEKVRQLNTYIQKVAQTNQRLRELNQLQQIATERSVAVALEAEKARVLLEQAVAAGTLVAISTQFIEKPETQEPMGALVNSGGAELANEMLGSDLTVVNRNTVAGWVKGERVYIRREGTGSADVFLRYGERQIPVELTQPNAIGFDRARSEKASYELGAEAFAKNEALRTAFLQAPGDEVFMGRGETQRFKTIVTILVGEQSPETLEKARLEAIGIVRDGVFKEEYARAFQRTLELWASGGNFDRLKNTVTLDDLQTLAKMWDADRKGDESVPALTPYTLEEVRAYAQE